MHLKVDLICVWKSSHILYLFLTFFQPLLGSPSEHGQWGFLLRCCGVP